MVDGQYSFQCALCMHATVILYMNSTGTHYLANFSARMTRYTMKKMHVYQHSNQVTIADPDDPDSNPGQTRMRPGLVNCGTR